MDSIHNLLSSMTYLGGRLLLFALFCLGLGYIGITDPKTMAAILVLMVLMMLFRRKTASMAMSFVLVWSLGIYLNITPTYKEITPEISNSYSQVKTLLRSVFPPPTAATNRASQEQSARNVQVQPSPDASEQNAQVQPAREQLANSVQLLAAVDEMAKNGRIRAEDAENIKLGILKQASLESAPKVATQE